MKNAGRKGPAPEGNCGEIDKHPDSPPARNPAKHPHPIEIFELRGQDAVQQIIAAEFGGVVHG
jgi:hypothetical protein